MATIDLSRSAQYPAKHYRGARMQQGRVLTDDDYNEGEALAEEEARVVATEVIGPYGSPDLGFFLSGFTAADGFIDFDIHAGAIYLGGMRLALEAGEAFRHQRDWLRNPGVTAPESDRHDLVYLEAWVQPVSAVEDEELLEAALNGPDTSQRQRVMRRVRVLPDAGGDCSAAWELLKASLAGDGLGAIDGYELKPDTRLRVGFLPTGIPENLCNPPAAGGYLGAENQAIRVQLAGAGAFTWGFDNAAPLYRVQVDADLITVTVDTDFKDQAHWPQAGQVVELLPWSAVLANGEKLAEELLPGHLAKVGSSYDPDSRTFTLNAATALPSASFGMEWTDRDDVDELKATHFGKITGQAPYLFMRVWNRGSDLVSDPAIAITAGAIPLGNTGLTVEFLGDDRAPGDHWIVSARPETRDEVVPWELEAERAPHGFRRFYAPLGLVAWTFDADEEEAAGTLIHDCRMPFRPLTQLRGCCTYTVGDGNQSHGDFTSIQAAVDNLPPSGGRVCLLPGEYEEAVAITGRTGVSIHGCGVRSRWIAPAGEAALLTVNDSTDLLLESFLGENLEGNCLLLFGKGGSLARVTLKELSLRGRDKCVVLAAEADHLAMRGCEVTLSSLPAGGDPSLGQEPAVFLAGDDMIIEDNSILAEESDNRNLIPLGGLQIGGGSERVRVRGNRIRGGNGNGITLGSILYVERDNWGIWDAFTWFSWGGFYGGYLVLDENGCLHWVPGGLIPVDPGGNPMIPVSAGDLEDVQILENDIEEMGANGISVAHFFALEDFPDFITTRRLTIARNRIRRCLRLELQPFPADVRPNAAYGGIVLADGEYIVIRDNEVEDNGFSHLFPICGIFVLAGDGLDISGNRVLHNGPRTEGGGELHLGQRGGIVLALARPRAVAVEGRLGAGGFRQDGVPAARIHQNIVVACEGRALQVLAIGPVSVEANQFTAHGSDLSEIINAFLAQSAAGDSTGLSASASVGLSGSGTSFLGLMLDLLGGAAVSIANLGMSTELYLQFLGLGGMAVSGELLDLEGQVPGASKARLFANGNILCNDNQIALDSVDGSITLGLSAVLLLSLDDVAFEDNQVDLALLTDFIFVNTLALGWSVRVSGNRFKEGIINSILSALTMALFNNTHHNQGTHCFLAVGLPALSVTVPNRAYGNLLASGDDPEQCESWAALGRLMGSAFKTMAGPA